MALRPSEREGRFFTNSQRLAVHLSLVPYLIGGIHGSRRVESVPARLAICRSSVGHADRRAAMIVATRARSASSTRTLTTAPPRRRLSA